MATIYTQVTRSPYTAGELNDSFVLLTDSQDIAAINDYFGSVCKDEDFSSFFVTEKNGEYTTVYGCHYSVPYNTDPLYLVEMIHE